MIVSIKRNDSELSEWVMIELQGELERASSDPRSGEFIGDLHYNKSGIPILIIGMHMILGKETKLDKPLAVLEKKSVKDDDDNDCYIVKSIIRKKLIFRGRPKPIVSDVPLSI
ncbi:hypothetical protein HCN44_005757 [Aphidius gifuensis]|uniref:Uncharacterized protein n=1 Tax=Aphidius gifuensis TaxID=684658 RepID=A0A834XVN1_APHGI|nr:chromosome transmission fidelity protein 8 homolog [Aphidius gifuensis]KAF7992976.1 hypothetical protein HCN44_005757 [Aphidius gifuensis]